MLSGHCKLTLGIIQMFSLQTSGAEIAITEAVTTGRHPQGPLVPLPGPLPSVQSLPPSSGLQRRPKSTCVNIVVKNLVSWVT